MLKHSKKIVLFLLFTLLAVFMGACSNYYHVTTNALSDTQMIGNGFPAESSFSIQYFGKKDPLLAKEISNKIEKLLKDKGYRIAPEANQADYHLTFTFEMTHSSHTVQVAKYIPGETVFKETKYKGTTFYESKKTLPGTTIYVPETQTYFHGKLQIIAYDGTTLKKNRNARVVWKGTAHNSDTNSDLREVIDYLLVPVFAHFGKDTKKSQYHELKENHESLQVLKSP